MTKRRFVLLSLLLVILPVPARAFAGSIASVKGNFMRKLALLALLLIPGTAGAIPIGVPALIHATFSTCTNSNCGLINPPIYNFDALLNVIPSSGFYLFPDIGVIAAGPDIGEVAAMSGTLNGLPIIFDQGTGLSRSLLIDDYFPGHINFSTSDGRPWVLAYDRSPLPVFGGTSVIWHAEVVSAPEPQPLLLLGFSVPLILLVHRRATLN